MVESFEDHHEREHKFGSAVAVTDTVGIGSLTIRSLARELGVTPTTPQSAIG